jgi:hypothetical protein
LDLVSSTHCGKAKADGGYCNEVAYSVHNIRVFERALAYRPSKPTPPCGSSLSNQTLDLYGRTSPKKPHAKALRTGSDRLRTHRVTALSAGKSATKRLTATWL